MGGAGGWYSLRALSVELVVELVCRLTDHQTGMMDESRGRGESRQETRPMKVKNKVPGKCYRTNREIGE